MNATNNLQKRDELVEQFAAKGSILILDNYDSFTYNLVHIVKALGVTTLDVYRNDQIELDAVEKYDAVILSPGPGLPSESGIMPQLVSRYGAHIPMLGVCLGHQCIAESYGGTLYNLSAPVHGKSSTITILDTQDPLYHGLDTASPINVGRYHSWAVAKETLPDSLLVTAETADGVIMSFRHKEYPVFGIQYHPESVLTELGRTILSNWLYVCAQQGAK